MSPLRHELLIGDTLLALHRARLLLGQAHANLATLTDREHAELADDVDGLVADVARVAEDLARGLRTESPC